MSLNTDYSWAEIIDSIVGIFKPPFSIGSMKAVHLTLSLPFDGNNENKVMCLINVMTTRAVTEKVVPLEIKYVTRGLSLYRHD